MRGHGRIGRLGGEPWHRGVRAVEAVDRSQALIKGGSRDPARVPLRTGWAQWSLPRWALGHLAEGSGRRATLKHLAHLVATMALSSDRISELRGEAQELSANLQVGKAGLTDSFLEEVRASLKRDRLVKLRLLRSARAGEDRAELAEEIASRAQAVLIEVRGNTVVLYRPRKHEIE